MRRNLADEGSNTGQVQITCQDSQADPGRWGQIQGEKEEGHGHGGEFPHGPRAAAKRSVCGTQSGKGDGFRMDSLPLSCLITPGLHY